MADFDLHKIVAEFRDTKSTTSVYEQVLNKQAVKYANALGYEGLEFVDCAPHHLIDQNGNEYLDMIAGFAVHHWGRRHPVIESAMAQAAAGHGV